MEKPLRMLNLVHLGRVLKSEIIEAHDLSVAEAASHGNYDEAFAPAANGVGSGIRTELEYLPTFIHQLHKKIEDDTADPQYLKTEPPRGLPFCGPTAVAD